MQEGKKRGGMNECRKEEEDKRKLIKVGHWLHQASAPGRLAKVHGAIRFLPDFHMESASGRDAFIYMAEICVDGELSFVMYGSGWWAGQGRAWDEG
jgi:hypothetical protein